jgi:hypothetical protein
MQAGEFFEDPQGPRIFGMTAADRVLQRNFEAASDSDRLPSYRLTGG